MVYIHSWADKRPNTITTKADSDGKKTNSGSDYPNNLTILATKTP